MADDNLNENGNTQDHTHCGCNANDPTCYCDENGNKKFRKIPKNG